MCNYRIFLFCMLLINNSVTIPAPRRSAKRKNIPQTQVIVHKTEEKKPVIIFDLVNVLFKENQAGFAQKIGYGTLTSYALTHWKNPGTRCLDMLDTISKNDLQKPHISLSLNGKMLPRCIVELYEGKKTCLEAKKEIIEAIELLDQEKFFSSAKEKKLMLTIMNLMLDSETIHFMTEPIKSMTVLAQKLKQNGHSLYLCANIPEEFYGVLQKKYPHILALFDGIVISSHIKIVKPDQAMFNHLITTHKLNPQECILIDNCKNNISTAESLGMRGVVYEKTSGINQFLRKQGINISRS